MLRGRRDGRGGKEGENAQSNAHVFFRREKERQWESEGERVREILKERKGERQNEHGTSTAACRLRGAEIISRRIFSYNSNSRGTATILFKAQSVYFSLWVLFFLISSKKLVEKKINRNPSLEAANAFIIKIIIMILYYLNNNRRL